MSLITNYWERVIQYLDINDGLVGSELTDTIPAIIKEHDCLITTRQRESFGSSVESFYLWIDDSETLITSDGGGGGGGGTSGGGGSNNAVVADDIVAQGVLFGN